ncbi:GNAT family N-acetyltransferase [Thalassiella azotivora]
MSAGAPTSQHAPGEVVVERLGPADAERFRALRLTALAADPDAFFSTLDAERDLTDDAWRERLAGTTATWAASLDGQDVGLVGCVPVSHDGFPELVSLWVGPGARGRGVGRLLVETVADFARGTGARELHLWLADSNTAAAALYDRLGAVPTGRAGHFPEPRGHLAEHERTLHLR